MTVSLQGSCENSSDVVHTCHLSVINHLITHRATKDNSGRNKTIRSRQHWYWIHKIINRIAVTLFKCCVLDLILYSLSMLLHGLIVKGQQSDLTNYNEMTSVAVELFINIELQQRQGDIIRTTWLQIVLLSSRRFGCTVLFVILIYSVYKKRHWA